MDIVEESHPKSAAVWPFIGGLVLGIMLAVVGFTTFKKSDATAKFDPATAVDFAQRLGLYGVTKEGAVVPTGLDVPSAGAGESWIHPYIVVSPDATQVAYVVWQSGKMHVHVAHVDGTEDNDVAEQSVASGQGEFVRESFGWGVDGRALFWQERQSACGTDGRAIPGVGFPYDCGQKLYTMYRLTLASGETSVVDTKVW
jgi:hypothetical protein